MLPEVEDRTQQEGYPLLQDVDEGCLGELPEAQDNPDDRHPLQHVVDVLKPLELLFHHFRLVEVGAQGQQYVLVGCHQFLLNRKRNAFSVVQGNYQGT